MISMLGENRVLESVYTEDTEATNRAIDVYGIKSEDDIFNKPLLVLASNDGGVSDSEFSMKNDTFEQKANLVIFNGTELVPAYDKWVVTNQLYVIMYGVDKFIAFPLSSKSDSSGGETKETVKVPMNVLFNLAPNQGKDRIDVEFGSETIVKSFVDAAISGKNIEFTGELDVSQMSELMESIGLLYKVISISVGTKPSEGDTTYITISVLVNRPPYNDVTPEENHSSTSVITLCFKSDDGVTLSKVISRDEINLLDTEDIDLLKQSISAIEKNVTAIDTKVNDMKTNVDDLVTKQTDGTNVPFYIESTIAVNQWKDASDTSYKVATISSDKITEDTFVDIHMDIANQNKLTVCYTMSSAGKVEIFTTADAVPTEPVTLALIIHKAIKSTV